MQKVVIGSMLFSRPKMAPGVLRNEWVDLQFASGQKMNRAKQAHASDTLPDLGQMEAPPESPRAGLFLQMCTFVPIGETILRLPLQVKRKKVTHRNLSYDA